MRGGGHKKRGGEESGEGAGGIKHKGVRSLGGVIKLLLICD